MEVYKASHNSLGPVMPIHDYNNIIMCTCIYILPSKFPSQADVQYTKNGAVAE